MGASSTFDARLAGASLLRNASYWRGDEGSAWRDAAGLAGRRRSASGSSCGVRRAFVTQLSGEPFVPLAVCLARQLRVHRSACPLIVVYDDVTAGRNLSRASLDKLSREAVRSSLDRLVPLSSLIARAYADPSVAWPHITEAPSVKMPVSRRDTSPGGITSGSARSVADQHHQRLLPSSQRKNRFVGAANKYWLWALTEYEKLVRVPRAPAVQPAARSNSHARPRANPRKQALSSRSH